MKAEIICIGTELLLGHIMNTNASFIARSLAQLGIDHYFDTTVGDNHQRLTDTITTSLDRADIVITTGGLGPTVDDITTKVISAAVGRKLVLEKQILGEINVFFKRLNKKIPKDTLRQALIPEGTKWLKNPHGTAPGLIIELKYPLLLLDRRGFLLSAEALAKAETPPIAGQECPAYPTGRGIKGEGKTIIALPGPPREMQPMVEDYVVPYLRKKVKALGSRVEGGIIKSRAVKLIGLAEAAVNEKVKDLLNLCGAVQVGIYARLGEVELKIMAKAKDEKGANAEIDKIEKVIRKRFGGHVYGVDSETLEEIIGSLLKKRKKIIATAESCTGGLLANFITDVPGASHLFDEAVITYSNEAKTRLLGVRPETFKKYGAVSAQAAKEMARGVMVRARADIGVSITGIAGPTGATRTKPLGLVYIALATRNKVICRQFNFLGTRKEVKLQAAQAALNLIRCELL